MGPRGRGERGAYGSTAAYEILGPVIGARTRLTGAVVGLVVGCSPGAPPATEEAAPENERAAALAELDTAEWVKLYDPARAANGYTLAYYRRRLPMLIDMNGRVVHTWPEARSKSRLRLSPDGELLTLSLSGGVVEYAWEGELLWQWKPEDGMAHHDVIRLANGNVLVPVKPKEDPADELVEVDRDGRVVWRWRGSEHLKSWLERSPRQTNDMTHVNSVQELPPNDLFDQGHEAFRPGNLLVSARNLDLVFLVDRATGEVVWHYEDGLDLQHEAIMIPRGFPGHPRVLVFNNGFRNRYHYRQSQVFEIEPLTKSLGWLYENEDFYSPTSGIEQPLPNGNVLITSSRGGRAFEMTRDGEKVWEWVPPYDPNRPRRYAYDHAPQLAKLPRPHERAVRPPPGYRHVDGATHRFGRRNLWERERFGRERRRILQSNNVCTPMLLPNEPRVEMLYGLRPPAADGGPARSIHFAVDVVPADGTPVTVHEETVSPGSGERSPTVSLAPWALQQVELCVRTADPEDSERATEDLAYWSRVGVRSGVQDPLDEDDFDTVDLTPEELEAQRRHLRTLGYID